MSSSDITSIEDGDDDELGDTEDRSADENLQNSNADSALFLDPENKTDRVGILGFPISHPRALDRGIIAVPERPRLTTPNEWTLWPCQPPRHGLSVESQATVGDNLQTSGAVGAVSGQAQSGCGRQEFSPTLPMTWGHDDRLFVQVTLCIVA